MFDPGVMTEAVAMGGESPVMTSIDLTSNGVLGHFAKTTQNVQLLSFLLALDGVDTWAVDFEEDQAKNVFEIKLFIQNLQQFVETKSSVLHLVPEKFTDLLAHLTTSRCMYLIRFVGQHNDGFLEQLELLLAEAKGGSVNLSTVRRRLEAFGKAKLLGEIFSGKRLTRITKLMGSYANV